MTYTHLDDADIVRHVLNESTDELAIDLAKRLESWVFDAAAQEEITELDARCDSLSDDLDVAEQKISCALDDIKHFMNGNNIEYDPDDSDNLSYLIEVLTDEITQ